MADDYLMEDKAGLLKERSVLKAEITHLKGSIGSTNSSKRKIYGGYEKFWKEFNPLVEMIKDLRGRRDGCAMKIRELKGRREVANTAARNAAVGLRKLKDEKLKKSRSLGVRKSASKVAEEIDRLEFKLETEAFPFERERKLNKLLKEKKSELDRAKELSWVYGHLKRFSRDLHASRGISGTVHNEIQLHAYAGQKLHEEMLECAKRADELKASIRPMEKEGRELRKKLDSLKLKSREKLGRLKVVEKKLDVLLFENSARKKLEEERLLAETENRLAEKVKSGKKLTTDDLRMLQKEGS